MHPGRALIEAAILSMSASHAEIESEFGVNLWRHSAFHMPSINAPRRQCVVCAHPGRDQIDEAISNCIPYSKKGNSLAGVARNFGLSYASIHNHSSSEHAALVAERSASRLMAVREWAS